MENKIDVGYRCRWKEDDDYLTLDDLKYVGWINSWVGGWMGCLVIEVNV